MILMDFYIITIVSIGLMLCAYTDIKKQKIILAVPICLVLLTAGYWLITKQNEVWLFAVVGAVTAGITYFIPALLGKGGGGDVIMMAAIGFCIGIYQIVYLIIFTSVFYLCFLLIRLSKEIVENNDGAAKDILKKRYPYIPFVLAGWMLLLGYIYLIKGV